MQLVSCHSKAEDNGLPMAHGLHDQWLINGLQLASGSPCRKAMDGSLRILHSDSGFLGLEILRNWRSSIPREGIQHPAWGPLTPERLRKAVKFAGWFREV
eukprot:gnl/TRDRNA2_/TRDRNA2_70238_c0_seq2.p1 gnl/TRDRNA2_/TRDRNA2_70238_c0~~gnl/TRDRNA2_/TRDRNA2_70238_c0_seq2.p1  ORF type:complete len:100 (+),score=6.91 gnl/TRDRNA2_/TRDRNA2_70238_c0_seq2:245-544(+)